MIRLSSVFNHGAVLHFDVGPCLNGCKYCFAKTKGPGTTIRQIQNAIKSQDEPGLKNFYVKNRFPVFVSDHSDIFGCAEKDMCRESIGVLKELGFPILYLTKGTADPEKARWFSSILTPEDAVLLTITGCDDKIQRRIEPNAPLPSERRDFLKFLQQKRANVEICFSPICDGFITEKEILEIITLESNVFGWSIHRLHCERNSAMSKYRNYMLNDTFIKTLREIKVSGYSTCPELSFFRGLGRAEKKIFKKPVICSDDIDFLLYDVYKYFAKGKKKDELEKEAVGYCGIKYFINQKKEIFDFYKDCIVKKSEIKAPFKKGTYFYAALPDQMTFLDYFTFLWNNPDMLSPMNYARARYVSDKEGTVYWTADQPYFIKGGV